MTAVERTHLSEALTIIRALDGDESTGMCRCPAHDDKSPSLHVGEGASGKVLVKCHAGCSQEAVIEALRARDLWSSSAKSTAARRVKDSQPSGLEEHKRFRRGLAILRAAAEAKEGTPEPYLNSRGITKIPPNAMLLPAKEARRLTGKRFPALVLPISNREGKLRGAHLTWLNLGSSDKLDTNMPKRQYGAVKGGYVLIRQAKPNKPLIVAEGVETAMSVAEITGMPAIAALSASNLRSVRLPECSEVIVAADHDPAGRKAARELARKLQMENGGKVVRIAVPEGPKGYDWNDALQSGAPIADLKHKILKAARVKPPSSLALSVDEFLALEFPEQEHLMKPWLTTSGIAMIYANRGVGKSLLALSIGFAVAAGKPFLKWECERQANVLYVDGELPGRLLQKRLASLGPSPGERLKILNRDHVIKQKRVPLDLASEEDRDLLDKFIEEGDAKLIILDSILTLFGNDTQKDFANWIPIQNWAYKHREAGRTILYIHHDSRSGKPFGISGREIPMDSIIELKRDEKLEVAENETAFKLRFTKNREFFGADAAPMVVRLSPVGDEIEWQFEDETDSTRERAAKLKEEGYSQKDIAKELEITEGRVSQIVKGLKEDGRL